jgi:hypothetical protein
MFLASHRRAGPPLSLLLLWDLAGGKKMVELKLATPSARALKTLARLHLRAQRIRTHNTHANAHTHTVCTPLALCR